MSGERDDDRPGGGHAPWWTFAITSLAVVLVTAGMVVPGEGDADDPGRFAPQGLEARLATLDGAPTTEDELASYARLLDDLADICSQPRQQLGEQARAAQRFADGEGARSTTHAILTTVRREVDLDDRLACQEAFDDAARRATWCEPRGQRPCGF